jgi:hypothetical protein
MEVTKPPANGPRISTYAHGGTRMGNIPRRTLSCGILKSVAGWRNWQTQTAQNRPTARSWGFKSLARYQGRRQPCRRTSPIGIV